jgi:hypothetical protein
LVHNWLNGLFNHEFYHVLPTYISYISYLYTGGQHIIVKPEENLVVVFTAWDDRSIGLCNSFILESLIPGFSPPPSSSTTTTSSIITTIDTTITTTTTTQTITTTTTAQTSASSIFLGTATLLIIVLIKRRKMRYN